MSCESKSQMQTWTPYRHVCDPTWCAICFSKPISARLGTNLQQTRLRRSFSPPEPLCYPLPQPLLWGRLIVPHETSHITWITITIALTLKILKDLQGFIGESQKVRHNTIMNILSLLLWTISNLELNLQLRDILYGNTLYIEIVKGANTNKIPILLKFYLLFGLLEFKWT